MVHRTDITGRSMGQPSSGRDGICRPALNGAFLENNFSLRRYEALPSPRDGSAAAADYAFENEAIAQYLARCELRRRRWAADGRCRLDTLQPRDRHDLRGIVSAALRGLDVTRHW